VTDRKGGVALRVVVAPDKFKGTLTSQQAARAMAAGVRQAVPSAEVVIVAVADGGEGTVAAAVSAGARQQYAEVEDALGTTVRAGWATLARTAVLESAQACGLQRIQVTARSSLASSSAGVGQLMAAALDAGCDELVIGLGGSACTDGGAGMASALGARLLDSHGRQLCPGGGALTDLAVIDAAGLDRRLAHIAVRIACDVSSPLLGPHGAARTFGPQKGAGAEEISRLEAGLTHYAELVRRCLGIEVSHLAGGGAAGGLAAGLVAFASGHIVFGVEYLLQLVDFPARLAGAALVITGEGCLDEQSLAGKAPAGVARMAQAAGVPVLAIAGRVELASSRLAELGIVGSHALVDAAPQDAERDAAAVLTAVTAAAVAGWQRRWID